MVVAALLRALLTGDLCCCFSSSFRLVSTNPFYTPVDKEIRQDVRRKKWNIWLSSTADDLDLVSDWWFWWTVYNGDRGGFEDQLTFLLFIFCCLGSLTWLLELVQISCVRDTEWGWLPPLIIIVEDIPQLILTVLIINGDDLSNMSSIGVFNLMTSLYSLMIRIAGELFMNCCFCLERVPKDVEHGGQHNPLSDAMSTSYTLKKT
jgi:hypothetical protein